MKQVKNVTILTFSEVKKHDKVDLKSLVDNTYNTWQTDRTIEEKAKDTLLGKFAEDCVISALEEIGIKNYYSYDSFRNDDYKYHAPFDGLLCDNLNNDLIDLVNNAVITEGSKLSSQTRDKIRNMNAVTIEIKSTRLAQKYKDKANFKSYEDDEEVLALVESLCGLDFLTYPYFTRYGNMTFDQYCWYAETKFLHTYLRGQELRDYVTKIELKNASDIYIRVFIDEEKEKALIMGWIDRYMFFNNPTTHKLILPGKSEIPLYFVKPLSNGKSLEDLKKDYCD